MTETESSICFNPFESCVFRAVLKPSLLSWASVSRSTSRSSVRVEGPERRRCMWMVSGMKNMRVVPRIRQTGQRR